MIAIRKEKREEAMAKKRINVGGGGDQHQQIHPNVFDTSDSTAMTHEQRTHAKVPTTRRRRPSMSFVRRREEEGAVGRSVFFFMCLLSSPLFPNQREEGDLSSARRGSDLNTSICRRIFSFVFF